MKPKRYQSLLPLSLYENSCWEEKGEEEKEEMLGRRRMNR